MIKLVLFDFDGVIADSNSSHIEVTRRVLKSVGLGRDISEREIYDLFGMEYKVVLRKLLADDYSEEKLSMASGLQQELLHSGSFFQGIVLFPKVRDLLSTLRGKGIWLAVATGNDRRFIDKLVDVLGLDGFFDLVLSSDDVSHSKPAPDMVLKAVDYFGVAADEVLFVGDSRNDVLAAKSAGVKSAAVLTGILDKQGALRLNPDFIVNDVSGIDGII
ncbi:MAG: HAD family hydrolase [Candidatus Altiarchaeota archaeon]|nr:HAD family hydrolase [Candidatus Altiarchaeota archaeon]